MQNKGAIRLFAILLALVSLYQLSFTFKTRSVENDAKAFATKNNLVDPVKEFNYLDSMANKTVYNFAFGLRPYTYKECKDREINFGLDLKGGMNLTLEVRVADIVYALSNHSTDETFNKAMVIAIEKEKKTGKDFITLFGDAFSSIDEGARLAVIFNTIELKDKINLNSTNAQVLKVIGDETQGAIDNAFNILRTRIDRFGVTQPNIQKLEKTGRVLIELPGVVDPKRVRKLLQGTASLEFWETYDFPEFAQNLMNADAKSKELAVASKAVDTLAVKTTTTTSDNGLKLLKDIDGAVKTDVSKTSATSLFTYLQPNPRQSGSIVGVALSKDTSKVNALLSKVQIKEVFPNDIRFYWAVKAIPQSEMKYWSNQKIDDKESLFELYAIRSSRPDGRAPLEGDVVTSARAATGQKGGYEIDMAMNNVGASTWARLTGANIGRQIAIVLDGMVYSAPNVNDKISGGRSSISGNFTPEEAKDLANILKSGKLPAPARIIEDIVVGPSLGAQAVTDGLNSFLWAFVIILLYMMFYYGWKAGAIADFALILNLFFIMGVLASFGAVLTLPGITGIILTIGMSVDANVLIYERIREELKAGKNIKLAITDGYHHAYSAIIDSNATTFLTGFILFSFGTGPVQGFATTLMIGIVTSFFTAIFITRIIFEWLMTKEISWKFDTRFTRNLFKDVDIQFLKKRKSYYIFSIILSLVAVGALFTQGLKLGIDFTGGRTYVIKFEKPVSSSAIQADLAAVFTNSTCEVKTFGAENQIRVATNFMVSEADSAAENRMEDILYTGIKKYLPAGTSKDTFIDDYQMSSQKVGPTIASDITRKAFLAVFYSILVIFVYIFIRFKSWQFSLGAIVALLHDAIIVIGAFALLHAFVPFSLEVDQGFIAAILTVIGYSTHDTVIVFDRIRENLILYPKRDRYDVANHAINITLGRTLNTSMTVLLVVVVIFLFGGAVLKGFVFAIIIGVFIGTYSSIAIATPIALSVAKWSEKKAISKPLTK